MIDSGNTITQKPERKLSNAALFLAGVRSLFLESSFNNTGRQNLGYAAVVRPLLKSRRKDFTKEERLSILKPFNTNPFLSGLVIGASLSLSEESEEVDVKDRDDLISCLASATGAKGDQLFWNTWLHFSALLAFFVTWRYGWWLGPFLLPLVFSAVALPVRFLGLYWGYKEGVTLASGRLNALVLGLRRRLQSFVLFAQGFLTALVLDSIPNTDGIAQPGVVFFASAFFLCGLAGLFLYKRYPKCLSLVYLCELIALFLILSLI